MDVATIRSICLALPAVTEDIKWEHDLVFSVGGKMFCVTSLEGPFKASFKVPPEAFEEYCAREGFFPAPYLARAKWVMVSEEARLSKKDWEHYLHQSYEQVKAKLTRKVRSELSI